MIQQVLNNYYVNFGMSIMKQLLDLANENQLYMSLELGSIFMDVSQTLEIAIHVLKSALSYHLLYGTYIMYQSSVVVTSVVTSPVKS